MTDEIKPPAIPPLPVLKGEHYTAVEAVADLPDVVESDIIEGVILEEVDAVVADAVATLKSATFGQPDGGPWGRYILQMQAAGDVMEMFRGLAVEDRLPNIAPDDNTKTIQLLVEHRQYNAADQMLYARWGIPEHRPYVPDAPAPAVKDGSYRRWSGWVPKVHK